MKSQIIVDFEILAYPLAFDAPPLIGGSSRPNIVMPFGMVKLEWCGHPKVKNYEDMFIRFDTMHERDGHTHTHRQTDTARRHRPRLHSIARQLSGKYL